jgi:hypothetical protein
MIINLTKKKIISNRTLYTRTFKYRVTGLRKKYFKYYDAIVFQRCNFIHTVFTPNNYSIIFVTSDNKICKIINNIKIMTPIHYSISANSIVCIPSNTINFSNNQLGDILDLNAEVTESSKKKLLKSNPLAVASVEGSFLNLQKNKSDR